MIVIPELVAGALLLVLGRRLFWLFVGAIGFLYGMQLAQRFLPNSPGTALIAGVVLGIIGALLAILFQRFAVGAAGFLAGGYIALSLATAAGLLGPTPGTTPNLPTVVVAGLAALPTAGLATWIVFIVGGVIGALLVAALFDWALIILSSLAGASLIVQALSIAAGLSFAAFIVLAILGIVGQARMLRRR